MFICLSSGASPRYRDDILRSLALPPGALLPFRYDKRYLAQSVRLALDQAQVSGQPALIVYIDQQTQGQLPNYVPCRFATITSVSEHGTTVSLELAAGEFAYAENLEAFNLWTAGTFPADLPAWDGDKLQGKYWFRSTQPPLAASRTRDLRDWEKIVGQLATHADFDTESCYYTITSLRRRATQADLTPTEGAYCLDGGTDYELVLYHYHPSKPPTNAVLTLQLEGSGLEFTTNPVLRIDSRYDQKAIRFHTDGGPARKRAFLTLFRGIEGQDAKQWQFDLPIVVDPRLMEMIGYTLLIGVLLASPLIMSTLASSTLASGWKWGVSITAVLCSLGAAFIGVFALKRPW